MLYTPPKLYVVVPCFNEEDVITQTLNRLLHKLHTMIESTLIAPQSAIVCIDDGSSDGTWQQINQFSPPPPLTPKAKNLLYLLSLLNFHAILDIKNMFDEFIAKYKAGNDIVLGIRNNRNTDSLFKKYSASLFYDFMNLMGTKVIKITLIIGC